jgi:hypothetical protein
MISGKEARRLMFPRPAWKMEARRTAIKPSKYFS